jgi:hypothetical protein
MSTQASSDDWPFTERVAEAHAIIQRRREFLCAANARHQELRREAFWGARPFLWLAHHCYWLALLCVFPFLWLRFFLWWVLRASIAAFFCSLGLVIILGVPVLLFVWFIQPTDPYSDTLSEPSSTDTLFPTQVSSLPQTYPSSPVSEAAPQASEGWESFGRVISDPRTLELVIGGVQWVLEQKAGNGAPKDVHVDSHVDRNGRFVPEHHRSRPNSNK